MGSFNRSFRRNRLAAPNEAQLGAAITELRRRVLDSKKLSEVFDHFDAALASEPSFIAAGVVEPNEPLVGIVRVLVRTVRGEDASSSAWLIHIREHELWHGGFEFGDGTLAVVIYFTDIERGVLGLMRAPTDPLVHYMRFSLPPGLTGPIDPEGVVIVSYTRRAHAGVC